MLQNHRQKAYLLNSGFILAFALTFGTTGSAEARLGESIQAFIQAFRSKVAGAFTLRAKQERRPQLLHVRHEHGRSDETESARICGRNDVHRSGRPNCGTVNRAENGTELRLRQISRDVALHGFSLMSLSVSLRLSQNKQPNKS